MIAYDTGIHLIKREDWIKSIVDSNPDSIVAVDKGKLIVGYAGVYHCAAKNYTELKPMLANNLNVAIALLEQVIKVTPKDHLFKVNIITENSSAVTLFEHIGFSMGVNAPDTVMFNKHKFQVDTTRVYSILNGNNQFA